MVSAIAHALHCLACFLTCDGIDMIRKDSFLPKIFTVLPYALGFVILVHLSGWFSKRWARKKDIQVAQFFAYLKNRWPPDCLCDHFVF